MYKKPRNRYDQILSILEYCEESRIVSAIGRGANMSHYNLVEVLYPLVDKGYIKKIETLRETSYISRVHRKDRRARERTGSASCGFQKTFWVGRKCMTVPSERPWKRHFSNLQQIIGNIWNESTIRSKK